MAKNKTVQTDPDVFAFISVFADTEQRKKDSHDLVKLMQEVSGYEVKMWGPSIIGFGNYHYKYESGHEGDGPLIGFSPRKAAISLYVFTGLKEHEHLLLNFGKFKITKACIYVKRLADIDTEKLKVMITESINYLHAKYGHVKTEN